ncbi:MAG TPA: type II secretion system protein [Candidatus Acidoferrum sp.]|nr:type II secretion system protein [Candidatus Acidoferrum sp.]
MNAKRINDSGTWVLNRGINNHTNSAFTLTELLVVLATLAIFAVLVLPGLAGPQPRSQVFQCLNNMRQLTLAWTMYAGDNNERLAINSDPHTASSGASNPSWVTGTLDWTSGSYNTNRAYLINNKYSLFGNYIATSTNVFECPAANYVSPPERALGWYQRARSVAMDAAVGDGSKFTGFGWSQWYVVKKTTDFNNPGPSQSWVFTDEHPDSIDDALLYTSSYPTTSFTEMPANYHDGAAAITFADGHAVMQKWTGSALPYRPVKYALQDQVACLVTDPDMVWLAQHTPRSQ